MKISQNKFQAELKKLVTKYVKLLNLKDWEIDIVISKTDLVSFNRGKTKNKKADYYADVIYKHMLKYASITLTKLQTVDKFEELEDTILHELLHIKFAPLIELNESLINLVGLKKDKCIALLEDLDDKEHEIIKTMSKLIFHKKRDK